MRKVVFSDAALLRMAALNSGVSKKCVWEVAHALKSLGYDVTVDDFMAAAGRVRGSYICPLSDVGNPSYRNAISQEVAKNVGGCWGETYPILKDNGLYAIGMYRRIMARLYVRWGREDYRVPVLSTLKRWASSYVPA